MILEAANPGMIEKAKNSMLFTGASSCLVTFDGHVFPNTPVGKNDAQNYVIKKGNKIAVVTRAQAGLPDVESNEIKGALKLKESKGNTIKKGAKAPVESSKGDLGAPPKSPEGSPSGDAGAGDGSPSGGSAGSEASASGADAGNGSVDPVGSEASGGGSDAGATGNENGNI